MTTPHKPPKPPYPPKNDAVWFSFRDTHLVVSTSAGPTKIPIPGAMIYTVDSTGQRVTVTRLVAFNVFAFAAKKKVGHVSVIVAGPDGTTATGQAKAKDAPAVLAWAEAFNAWSAANPPSA